MSTAIEDAVLPEVHRDEARRKFAEYKRAVESGEGTKVDQELLEAYRQVGMGRTVISLNRALQGAGVDSDGRPVLAVANAGAKWVWFYWSAGDLHDVDGEWIHSASAFVSDHAMNPDGCWEDGRRATKTGTFRFPRDYFPLHLREEIRARVPLVPPALRPKACLQRYTLLWEADWENAPGDPYLLRRVTQDLFVVLAQWDLTEIERSVLEMATVGAYKPR